MRAAALSVSVIHLMRCSLCQLPLWFYIFGVFRHTAPSKGARVDKPDRQQHNDVLPAAEAEPPAAEAEPPAAAEPPAEAEPPAAEEAAEKEKEEEREKEKEEGITNN
jgi:hypothetical protein